MYVLLVLFRMRYTRELTGNFMNERILALVIGLALSSGFARGLKCIGDPCMYGICLEDANRYTNK